MSYQVLARKWRPRTFHELVGQQHVSRALINALDQGRLHHAYLFTGTRGVGKTTIARIFAKCLNCEQGVTSTPCGECQACRSIDEGRFVDLIEVDAASRTKVEDTRELLDNVQYAPTQGRFKVYLIDEVHMLSSHSFNALLKTLEEPPPHVKFLLATTDPQKLPITVLSRCLQFALKAMPPEQVVAHLTHILTQEQVTFDETALWLLGRAADGSMRDALSLTDQAISFGQGNVSEGDVRAMLGTLDHRYIINLAESIATVDAAAVLAQVARLAEQAPDFAAVLDELASLFHRLAVAQMVPNAVDNGLGDRQALLDLANRFSAEDVQLYYQISLAGRGEMNNAPEPRAALEMTLLRMLAFRPQGIPRPPDVDLPIRADSAGHTNGQRASGQNSAADGTKAATDEEPDGGNAAYAPAEPAAGTAAPAAADDHAPSPVGQPANAREHSPASADGPSLHQAPWDDQPAAQADDTPSSAPQPPASEGTPRPADAAQQPQLPDAAPVAPQPSADAAQQESRPGSQPPWSEPPAADNPMPSSGPAALTPPEASAPDQPPPSSDVPSVAAGESMASPSPAPGVDPAQGAAGRGTTADDIDDDVDDDDGYAEYAALEPSNDLNEAFSQALDEDVADSNPDAEHEASSIQLDDSQVIDQARWLEIFPAIKLGGISGNLIANCAVSNDSDGQLTLCLDPSQAAMNAEIHARRLEAELARLGATRRVVINPGHIDPTLETPHARRMRLQAERRARAVEALRDDPHIKALQQAFGARLIEDSVTSNETEASR